jgi:hypothetical protein
MAKIFETVPESELATFLKQFVAEKGNPLSKDLAFYIQWYLTIIHEKRKAQPGKGEIVYFWEPWQSGLPRRPN